MIKLYKKLPIFLQNIILTIKNNQIYYLKFKAFPFINPLKKVYNNLDTNNWINDDNEIDRINKLIKTAIENVPYYIEHKEKYTQINSLDDLKSIPILDKPTFKKRNKEFLSKLSNSSNTYYFKTSGSTGTPIEGGVSLVELNNRFFTFLASLKKNNINYSNRVGRFLGAEVASEKKVYRKDYINNHFLFSIYHISQDNIQKYFDAIVNHKIEIIEGYPSTIYAMVKLFKSNNLNISSVKNVLTTAEKLLDYQKEEIQSFFNCTVFDFYGSSEGAAYMFSYGDTFVSANKVAIIEVVDEEYNPVAPGTLGKMLVTSFTSSFTPLIRYDIGDYCVVSKSQSSDNNELLIDEIIGRSEDVFETQEGIIFTRFSLCLKYLPDSIIESQLRLKQRSKNVKVIYTKLNEEIKNIKDFLPFEQKFMSMLGKDYVFEYEFVEKFKKASRGKLRAVIIEEE